MNTKIIILTGKAQSGKDSASEFIKSKLLEINRSCSSYSFAGSLKEICHNILGLSYEQCWGENIHKDTLTIFKWSDLPIDNKRLAQIMIKNKSFKQTSDFMTAREIMQVWGTDIFRYFYQDCWVRAVVNKIDSEKLDFAIVTDARFKNEIDYIKKYRPIIIRLNRNILDQFHQSELDLDDYDFSGPDTYLINNSLMSIEEKNIAIEKVLLKYL